MEWIKTKHVGVRFYEHDTKRFRGQPDKYFVYRFKVGSFSVNEGVGFASEGWTAQKVSAVRSQFIEAAKRADGSPRSLKESRAQLDRKDAARSDFNKTVREWGEEFCQEYEGKEQKDKRNWLNRFVYPTLGNRIPNTLTEEDIKRLVRKISKMSPANNKKIKIAPRSIELVLTYFGQVLKMAGIQNPPTSVRLAPKYDNTSVRYLERIEQRMLFDCLCERSQRTHDQAMIALHCGLRVGEIFKIKVMHCVFNARTIEIMDPKNKSRNRTLYMTKNVYEILKRYAKGKKRNDYVFLTREGKKQNQISAIYFRTVKELGFNDGITDRRFRVDFHTLRHTYASWLMQGGAVTLYELQKLLGHEGLAMTEKYAKLAPENVEKSASYINGNF